MADNYFPIQLQFLTGGEASIYPIFAMPAKYSMLMQNCHISSRGGVEKIPGYAKLNANTCGVNLTNGFEFRKTAGTRIILCSGGGKIFKLNESTGALTEVKGSLSSTSRVRYAAMNDLCIAVNGVDAPLKSSDGTTWATLGGSPPSTAFKAHVHKGRVWFLERTNKMLATCTSLNNPEESTGGTSGYIDFKYVLKVGDELLDISSYQDLLVFYFRNHIAIYSGNTPSGTDYDFKLEQLIPGIGVVETDTIADYVSDSAFLYMSGVASLKQSVVSGKLNVPGTSTAIEPTIVDAMVANTGNIYGCAHYPAKSWYFLLIKDVIWVYSYRWKAWGRIIGADVNGLFGTVKGEVYFCGNGYVHKYGTGWTFGGISPEMKWDTAYVRFDKRGRKGFPRIMEILSYPGSGALIDYYQKFNYAEPDPALYGQFESPSTQSILDGISDFDAIPIFDDLDSVGGTIETPPQDFFDSIRVPLFGSGRSMQLSFYNKSASGPIEINGLTILSELGGY